jgi:hypothetical protein
MQTLAAKQLAPDISGEVQTTNAVTTVLATFTPVDGKTTTAVCIVSARKTDGTQGAGYEMLGSFRRNGGVVTQIDTDQIEAQAQDDPAWNVEYNVSGTTVQVRVTGVAATNIDWRVNGQIVVAP